ncbi:MAG: hypothetical protein QOE30_5033 [Mycobacterium sp.]|uniref:hypothetical protein n=1 Tax=Mycobacterium sp. TaxID=1785 RepID=UPI0028B9EB60|nr:hypothetical protein [Mycobacterium sp.]MDT5119294.1 hypothetical protein [Mycobacterium sp.]
MTYDLVEELLSIARRPAYARLHELMDRVHVVDMTTQEILALVAVLESADQRVNAHTAPVLQLITT